MLLVYYDPRDGSQGSDSPTVHPREVASIQIIVFRPKSWMVARYKAGVVFMKRRNTVVKWLCDEKPTARATFTIDIWGLISSSRALAMRISVRRRCGVFPVAFLKALRK